jgi:hypothetical protein
MPWQRRAIRQRRAIQRSYVIYETIFSCRILPRTLRHRAAARLDSTPPDPSVWSNEQQQEFLQALLGGPPPSETHPFNFNAPVTNSAVQDDPLIAFMSSLGSVNPGMGRPGAVSRQSKAEAKPHPKATAYFVRHFGHGALLWFPTGDIWNRWARLASTPAEQSPWGIEMVVSLPLVVAIPQL